MEDLCRLGEERLTESASERVAVVAVGDVDVAVGVSATRRAAGAVAPFQRCLGEDRETRGGQEGDIFTYCMAYLLDR